MLTTKQKLEKILKEIKSVEGEWIKDDERLREIVGYITAWLDDLVDED